MALKETIMEKSAPVDNGSVCVFTGLQGIVTLNNSAKRSIAKLNERVDALPHREDFMRSWLSCSLRPKQRRRPSNLGFGLDAYRAANERRGR
jgi:hypothetical protein